MAPEAPMDPWEALRRVDALEWWDPNEYLGYDELQERVRAVLRTLTLREELVIGRLFGLEGRCWTILEVAEDLESTVGRVRSVRDKAMRKLRHPTRSGRLKAWRECGGMSYGSPDPRHQEPSACTLPPKGWPWGVDLLTGRPLDRVTIRAVERGPVRCPLRPWQPR